MNRRFSLRAAALSLSALLLAACSTTQQPPEPPQETVTAPHFEPDSFAAMPAVSQEDWLAAFNAFRTSCSALRANSPFHNVCTIALQTPKELAQAFYEAN